MHEQRERIHKRLLFLIGEIGWRNGNPLTADQRTVLQAIYDSRGPCETARKIARRMDPKITADRFHELRDSLERCPRRIGRIGLDAALLTPRGRKDLLGY